jgi:hypothetical protein
LRLLECSTAFQSVQERSGAVDVCGVDAEKKKKKKKKAKKNLVVARSIR